jgi:hypothetical protein
VSLRPKGDKCRIWAKERKRTQCEETHQQGVSESGVGMTGSVRQDGGKLWDKLGDSCQLVHFTWEYLLWSLFPFNQSVNPYRAVTGLCVKGPQASLALDANETDNTGPDFGCVLPQIFTPSFTVWFPFLSLRVPGLCLLMLCGQFHCIKTCLSDLLS